MRRFLLRALVAVVLAAGLAAAATVEDGRKLYDAGDFEGAFAIWLPLAEAGDREAQYQVALSYFDGEGVAQDKATAADWFVKAALQADLRAQDMLGYMFSLGDGLPRNLDKARCWYFLAAEQGDAHAQSNLASFLAEHRSGNNFYWRQRAARQGHTPSMAKVGWVATQNPLEDDKTEGYMYLLLAAERGNEKAIADLEPIRRNKHSRVQRELAAAEKRAAAWFPIPERPPSTPLRPPRRCLPGPWSGAPAPPRMPRTFAPSGTP